MASLAAPGYAWWSGLIGDAAATFFLIAWISPPGWVENWQLGSWGEEATAKALRDLQRDGWTVLHDLPIGRGTLTTSSLGPEAYSSWTQSASTAPWW